MKTVRELNAELEIITTGIAETKQEIADLEAREHTDQKTLDTHARLWSRLEVLESAHKRVVTALPESELEELRQASEVADAAVHAALDALTARNAEVSDELRGRFLQGLAPALFADVVASEVSVAACMDACTVARRRAEVARMAYDRKREELHPHWARKSAPVQSPKPVEAKPVPAELLTK